MIEYEAWLLPYIPHRGEVAIDVGAHEGIWTRELAKRFKWVHAIEPNPLVFDALMKDLPTNVVVRQVAAWDREKLLRFNRYADPGHLSAYFEDEGIATGPPEERIELMSVALDSLDISGHIAFIKCDTEGAEVHVIRGAETVIRNNRPMLLIEIHSSENFETLWPILVKWQFRIQKIDHPDYTEGNPLANEHFWLFVSPSL
jgi:FkbM family methyltransferase